MQQKQEKVNKDDVNLRKGDDGQNCGLCQNWGPDGECSLLGIATLRSMVCDGFMPIEGDEEQPTDAMLVDLFGQG